MRAKPRQAVLFSALVLVASLLPAATPLRAAEPAALSVEDVPTNLGLAHAMAAQVAGATLDTLAARAGTCLGLLPRTEHSGNGLMELALAEATRRHGLRVATTAEACDRRLEFSILELRIAYTGVDRSALWTSREIERHGACVLACRLVDTASGDELATSQQEVVLADRVPYALKDLVSSPSYPFTSPELKERDWSKSAEPFVVTGMIAGLIYLFFSNQSGN